MRGWHLEGLAVRPAAPDARAHRLPRHHPPPRARRRPARAQAPSREGAPRDAPARRDRPSTEARRPGSPRRRSASVDARGTRRRVKSDKTIRRVRRSLAETSDAVGDRRVRVESSTDVRVTDRGVPRCQTDVPQPEDLRAYRRRSETRSREPQPEERRSAILRAEVDDLREAAAAQLDRSARVSWRAASCQLQTRLSTLSTQNERLVRTLKEAREQIVTLKPEVDRLAQPPSAYGLVIESLRRRRRSTSSPAAARCGSR